MITLNSLKIAWETQAVMSDFLLLVHAEGKRSTTGVKYDHYLKVEYKGWHSCRNLRFSITIANATRNTRDISSCSWKHLISLDHQWSHSFEHSRILRFTTEEFMQQFLYSKLENFLQLLIIMQPQALYYFSDYFSWTFNSDHVYVVTSLCVFSPLKEVN